MTRCDLPRRPARRSSRTGARSAGVTSASCRPRADTVIGLGYVHRDHAEAGTRLAAGTDESGAVAEVVGFAA